MAQWLALTWRLSLSDSTTHVDSGSIENEFYRATFDLWTGAMTGLDLKSASGAWQVLGIDQETS